MDQQQLPNKGKGNRKGTKRNNKKYNPDYNNNSSTNRKKFLLTLSNVMINIPGITFEQIVKRLQNPGVKAKRRKKPEGLIIPGCDVICVKEYHSNSTVDGDYHYHIVAVEMKIGISKNNYREEFRKAFPEFKGIAIDVRGVRRMNNTLTYAFKSIEVVEVLEFIMFGTNTTHITTNDSSKYWLKTIKLVPSLQSAFILRSMLYRDSIKQWRVARVYNIHLYTKNTKAVKQIWEIKDSLIPPEYVLSEYIDLLDKRDLYKRRRYDAICKDFNLTSSHIHAFAHILFGIILREGYIERITKSKSLIIAGTPNSGKTSMITALGKFFGTSIFYTVGARKDDFRGFNRSNSPLIVWDDLFGNKPNYRGRPSHRWSKHLLLKLLAQESIIVDVKYRTPIEVKSCYNIILTNDLKLIQVDRSDSNLGARLKIIRLPDGRQAQWIDLRYEDIQVLVLTMLNDLLKCRDLDYAIKYLHYGPNVTNIKSFHNSYLTLPSNYSLMLLGDKC